LYKVLFTLRRLSINMIRYFQQYIYILTLALLSAKASAQLMQKQRTFTRADTLRGMLTPLRTCYDINYYHLDVKFDIDQQYISGSNEFRFIATQPFSKLQFDLYANLKVDKVVYQNQELPFTREAGAVFVTFPKTIAQGSKETFTVFYSGKPTVAKNAPWDGGVVFKRDSLGKPWVATACQGAGASIWWPNKDHQADEVDSMLISISVPRGLKDVSNGRLRKTTELTDGYTRFDWFVSNPINNYDVAANIGDYTHFKDSYAGEQGQLSLDYWVLPYHLEQAKKQFGRDVKPMLKAFEHWFGPYPWYRDGYKLVETPHLGMEHQSAVAYGNRYRNGYLGRDLSGTGHGLNWDYIIVHESGHEWFGNNITTKDIADMWVHEAFTDYSESLFIENYYGKPAALEYLQGLRKNIQNDAPIIGPYNVNKEGSGDMYYKGANLLGMVRAIISNDAKWQGILRGLNKTFYHQTVTTEQVVQYINQQAGQNLTPVFDQYLRYANIPTLDLKTENGRVYGKWTADVKGFTMPVKLRKKGGDYYAVKLNTEYAPIAIPGLAKDNLEIDTLEFYIKLNTEAL
jgi:aminopeptidase N